MNKKCKWGFALHIIQFLVLLIMGPISYLLVFNPASENIQPSYILPIVMVVMAVIYLVFAIIGRKKRWANIITMIISLPFALGLLGIFGLLGSIFMREGLLAAQLEASMAKEAAADKKATTMENNGTSANDISVKNAILNANITDIVLKNADNEVLVKKIDYIFITEDEKDVLYVLIAPANGNTTEVYVAVYNDSDDSIQLVENAVAEKVYSEWQQKINANDNKDEEKLVLDLEDTIIHKSDWKWFCKQASQDEILALAIGSRYRLSGVMFFLKAIISVVGTILSIVLGISMAKSTGMFAIFILVGGYLFFNLLASKLLGYSDTYKTCYRKLTKENRAYVSSLFKDNWIESILRNLTIMLLLFFTIPYKAILMIIEVLVPSARNWTVAHGGEAGVVISMPKGYDISILGALGDYYKSCTFSDALDQEYEKYEKARLSKFSKYEYEDQYGIKREAYSDDGKNFFTYTDKLTQVGTSEDGGKSIDLK